MVQKLEDCRKILLEASTASKVRGEHHLFDHSKETRELLRPIKPLLAVTSPARTNIPEAPDKTPAPPAPIASCEPGFLPSYAIDIYGASHQQEAWQLECNGLWEIWSEDEDRRTGKVRKCIQRGQCGMVALVYSKPLSRPLIFVPAHSVEV